MTLRSRSPRAWVRRAGAFAHDGAGGEHEPIIATDGVEVAAATGDEEEQALAGLASLQNRQFSV